MLLRRDSLLKPLGLIYIGDILLSSWLYSVTSGYSGKYSYHNVHRRNTHVYWRNHLLFKVIHNINPKYFELYKVKQIRGVINTWILCGLLNLFKEQLFKNAINIILWVIDFHEISYREATFPLEKIYVPLSLRHSFYEICIKSTVYKGAFHQPIYVQNILHKLVHYCQYS